MLSLMILTGVLMLCAIAFATENTVLHVTMEDAECGPCSHEMITKMWPGMEWASLYDRVEIVADPDLPGKALRVTFPEGGYLPQGGGALFVVSIPPAAEYTLSYAIKFEEGFDFEPTGKLPGLSSKGAVYTGGIIPVEGDGWSARYMFKQGAKAIVYFYWQGMKGPWGDHLWFENFHFVPGQWHRLKQRIRVNTPGKDDASLEVWADDRLVYTKKDFQLRLGDKGLIDTFCFSTFHGGNTEEKGPRQTCHIRFADFHIWR